MKSILYLFIIILSLVLAGCEKEAVNYDDLVERMGLMYEKFSEEPYTGEMVHWSEEGSLISKGFYLDGLKTGLWEEYRDDDPFGWGVYESWTENYKEGKLNGLKVHKDSFGSISQGMYKDGKREGLFEKFNEDGSLNKTAYYKDDKREGIHRIFYRGGGFYDICYKNGVRQERQSFCEKK